MPHVQLPDDIRIRYDQRGPADARPLVLAHGFTVSLEMWYPQMEALSKDYRLITWDARGHGGSSAPPWPEAYTMPALAGDLRGLLEALDAVDGAIVGGMSFGGQIAAQYLVDHAKDVHAAILSDTVPRGEQRAVARSGFEEWAGDPGLSGGYHAMNTRPDLTRAFQDVDAPVLVIAGSLDQPIMSRLDRYDGLPRRRVVILDGCWHGTSSQRPRDWSDEVLRFLRDVEAGHPLGEEELR